MPPPTQPQVIQPTMSSLYQLPIQTRHDPTRTNRHARSRYYAHLVQESLTSRFAKCVCSIFISLMLIVGVIFFVLWLSLRPHRPRFYLNSFSLAGPNSPVAFNVSDRNPNQKIGVYYDNMTASVYFKNSLIASGPVNFPGYQPPKTTTLVQGQLPTTVDGTLSSQLSANEQAGRVELWFELQSIIRFKVNHIWDSHSHHLHVSCDFALGADGNLLAEFVNERCPIYF